MKVLVVEIVTGDGDLRGLILDWHTADAFSVLLVRIA